MQSAGKRVPSDHEIGLGFTSDWIKTWREFFEPIGNKLKSENEYRNDSICSEIEQGFGELGDTPQQKIHMRAS